MTDEKALALFTQGTSYAQLDVTVLMSSQDFIIFNVPGHKYWGDRLHPSVYAPVQRVLINKGGHCVGKQRRWEGRMNRKRWAEMQKALQASQDAGEVVL